MPKTRVEENSTVAVKNGLRKVRGNRIIKRKRYRIKPKIYRVKRENPTEQGNNPTEQGNNPTEQGNKLTQREDQSIEQKNSRTLQVKQENLNAQLKNQITQENIHTEQENNRSEQENKRSEQDNQVKQENIRIKQGIEIRQENHSVQRRDKRIELDNKYTEQEKLAQRESDPVDIAVKPYVEEERDIPWQITEPVALETSKTATKTSVAQNLVPNNLTRRKTENETEVDLATGDNSLNEVTSGVVSLDEHLMVKEEPLPTNSQSSKLNDSVVLIEEDVVFVEEQILVSDGDEEDDDEEDDDIVFLTEIKKDSERNNVQCVGEYPTLARNKRQADDATEELSSKRVRTQDQAGTTVSNLSRERVQTLFNRVPSTRILRQLHGQCHYQLVDTNQTDSAHRYTFKLSVEQAKFEGVHQNMKMAREAAAKEALLSMYNLSFTPMLKLKPGVARRIVNEVNIAKKRHLPQGDSALVMTTDLDMKEARVICISAGKYAAVIDGRCRDGTVLHDGHGSVLLRRCLLDFLYSQLEGYTDNPDQSVLVQSENGKYTLKPNVKFHMYLEQSPCGDACFAKPSKVGRLSMKGCRIAQPDVNKSMSCSDKICKWNVVGLQGSLLRLLLTEPVYVDGIILVGAAFNEEHAYRAVYKRVRDTMGPLPEPFRLNRPKITYVNESRLVRRNGVKAFWTLGMSTAEHIQGSVESKLSKKAFFQRFKKLDARVKATNDCNVYYQCKTSAKKYVQAKTVFYQSFQDANLGQWPRKQTNVDKFEI